MDKYKSLVVLPLLLFVTWMLLAGSLATDEIITGAAVSLVLTVLFYRNSVSGGINLNPKAIYLGIIYFFVFFVELVKSNLDVAWRVLRPSLPIRPGIVKVRTRLKSRIGRVILASSITLTPGTLTVETKDDVFYIHWINVRDGNVDEMTRELVRKFERYLEVIFG